jgi:hypothetical protein
MTRAEKAKVNEDIANEGFHYCFTNFSFYPEIKDPEFHRLREAYLEAAKALAKYVGSTE